jgi:hypothetical protein
MVNDRPTQATFVPCACPTPRADALVAYSYAHPGTEADLRVLELWVLPELAVTRDFGPR